MTDTLLDKIKSLHQRSTLPSNDRLVTVQPDPRVGETLRYTNTPLHTLERTHCRQLTFTGIHYYSFQQQLTVIRYTLLLILMSDDRLIYILIFFLCGAFGRDFPDLVHTKKNFPNTIHSKYVGIKTKLG